MNTHRVLPENLPADIEPAAAELIAKALGFPLEEDDHLLDPEYGVFVHREGNPIVIRRGFTNEPDAQRMVSLPGEWAEELCNDHRDAPVSDCPHEHE